MMKQIAVFASGAGTNAARLIDHFRGSDAARVALIVCNNPAAGVLEIAAREGIEVLLLDREQFRDGHTLLGRLQALPADLIVLAGFLWKVPEEVVRAFGGRMVNIHPALLPAYGGKGMYGLRVHEAVLAAGDRESGITIHRVNERYDEGEIILQRRCAVDPGDTPEKLAQKVHQLEYEWYPRVVEQLLNELPD